MCIAFYNIEPLVSRCLDSVLSSTYSNLEVICVNDGSTDGTSELLHKYANKDTRVIVIDKENGGIVSARNAAMEIVTGDFVAFVDGDDWIHNQYFEVLMAVQEKSGADAVVCGFRKTSEHIEDTIIKAEEVEFSTYGLDHVPYDRDVRVLIWGRIFSRRLIPTLKIDSELIRGEDAILNILFLCRCTDIVLAVTAEKLYYYYQRSDSLVHTVSHEYIKKICDFFIGHPEIINSTNAKKIILNEILKDALSYRYLVMFSSDKKEVRKLCRRYFDFCTANWGDIFSAKEKIKYYVLFTFPLIYRFYRIITDPTMIAWERMEKAERKSS